LFVLGWVAAFPGPALAVEDPLVLGIFPRRNAVDTVRMFTPLAQYLSRRLGREVRVETSKDFESFWQGVIQRRYDIVHYNQFLKLGGEPRRVGSLLHKTRLGS